MRRLVDIARECMESIQTLTSALEALTAAQARIGSLEADLSAAQSLLDEQTSALAKYSELHSQVETLTAQLAEAEKASAVSEMRITEALASVSVEPVDLSPAPAQAQPKSKDDLWAEYRSLSLYERNEFYARHKAILRS